MLMLQCNKHRCGAQYRQDRCVFRDLHLSSTNTNLTEA
jgi:hypothetical protein